MTPEYLNVLKHIESRCANSVKLKQSAILDDQSRAREMMSAISKVTAEFISTGIVDVSDLPYMYGADYHQVGFGNTGWRWSRYIKQLAIELGRPCIITSKSRHGNYVGLINSEHKYDPGERYIWITKFKYTNPLVAMFMLIGNCAHVQHSRRDWQITLRGTEGQAAYEVWRRECSSNPGYLRALRIIK